MPEQTSKQPNREDAPNYLDLPDWESVAQEYNFRNEDDQISSNAARSIHARAMKKLKKKLAFLLDDIQ